MPTESESYQKLKSLLRQLFQFDYANLDFGIYRIMNYRKQEIETFIEEDLMAEITNAFIKFTSVASQDKERYVAELKDEIKRVLGENAISKSGNIDEKFRDADIVQRYHKASEELREVVILENEVNNVLSLIHEFFSRYFDNGDFLSKRKYGGKERYIVPYNGEEVIFHWTNNDQYYIKTGEYFKIYSFKADDIRVVFNLNNAEMDNNSVKAQRRYFVLAHENAVEEDTKNQLIINFEYRTLSREETEKFNNKNIQDELLNDVMREIQEGDYALKKALASNATNTSLLKTHLNRYVKRNTTDYFIHKKLDKFLNKELDFFLKNEVIHVDEIENMDARRLSLSIAKMSIIRRISCKIIEFLAQIEDFQRQLYDKKKFVITTDYCITLDKIPEGFYEEIGSNEKQIEDWKRLFKLDEATNETLNTVKGKKTFDVDFLRKHNFLILDTKFFSQDFKDRLVATFDNLDKEVQGVLIKSENYQALSLLMNKYREHVKCVYIDPPFNTGSDEFLYKDNYQHSSWLSMMHDRLLLANQWLRDDGVIFISIDDREFHELRILLNQIFGDSNFISTFVWNTEGHTDNQFDVKVNHEYVISYVHDSSAMSLGYVVDPNTRETSNLLRGFAENSITKNGPGNPPSEVTLPKGFPCKVSSVELDATTVPGTFYDDVSHTGFVSREITRRYQISYPIRKDKLIVKNGALLKPCRVFSGWANVEKLRQFIDNGLRPIQDERGELTFYLSENGVIYYRRERARARNILSVLRNMGTTEQMRSELESMGLTYSYPKPKQLIKYLIKVGSEDSDIIVDFFAGSGTTGHSVIDLNREENGKRKFVLVEMADYFDTVLLPRIKKVIYSSDWKDGRPLSNNGISCMLKYQYIEQYEDTLNNIILRGMSKPLEEVLSGFDDYFLRYMLEFETRGSPTRLVTKQFQDPYDYKLKIGKYDAFVTIDLIETFNYLLGLDVRRIQSFNENNRRYKIVFGTNDSGNIAVIWRNTEDIDYKRDKEFVERTLGAETFSKIFVNGDSYIEGAEAIESTFTRLMGV